MNKTKSTSFFRKLLFVVLMTNFVSLNAQISSPTFINQLSPVTINYNVSGSLVKRVTIDVSTTFNFANLSLLANNEVLLDNIDIPFKGSHTLNALVKFPASGQVTLTLATRAGDVTVNKLSFENVNIQYPNYKNITKDAGITTGPALKYAGPTVADLNNDGHYDIVLNNHNDPVNPSKVIWNNGNGIFDKSFKIARWRLQDLHGSSAADFDNDGDLDLIATRGGGNGTTSNPPDFYINDNGTLTLSNEQVGLTAGARGRSAVWGDFDSDNDLDLILLNAQWQNPNGGKHVIYRNKGNGTFETIRIPNFENANGDRFVLTDIDGDHIDDFILFFPISVWKGNGDFTFTNVSDQWLPSGVKGMSDILAATDVDIDNDGDLDLYLSRGKSYTQVANKAVDFNPNTQILHVRDLGDQGRSLIDFTADGSINLKGFEAVYRSTYDGNFPFYLGSAKTSFELTQLTGEREITRAQAQGWPSVRDQNGIYIGHTGNGNWKVEVVRNGVLYWSIAWTLERVRSITPTFETNNKNLFDVLLRNDGNTFVNVSNDWNLPKGGNHWGVTTGDFNNDGFADLFLNRYPFLNERVTDYMLLNTGNGKFEITTSHGAQAKGESSHGDLGQAFDYDLDGGVDILDGSDERGTWHLYGNQRTDSNNFSIIHVGYSPNSNIDPISAEVTIKTANKTLFKRVGSAGSAHSQSLLNIVHFGLGNENQVQEATVRWRNGETKTFTNESANKILKTDDSTITPVDETVSCAAIPSVIPIKNTIIIPVNYTANQSRDIVVLAYDKGDWVGTGKAVVTSGSGVANVTLNLTKTPTQSSEYEFRTSIRPLGATWQNSIKLCTKSGVIVANGTEIVDCSVLPTTIAATTSITVPIYYAADQRRDVIVALWDTQWRGVGTTTVEPGSGIANVTINLQSLPTVGTTYSLRGAIRPVGTSWQQNINTCIQNNVNAVTSLGNRIGQEKKSEVHISEVIQVYPNPFSRKFEIKGLENGIYTVTVNDLSGKQLLKKKVTQKKNKIKMKGMSAGMYVIEVVTPNGKKKKINVVKK